MSNVTVKVIQDMHPSNPRTEWDNLGTMACWHGRYELGDEQPNQDPEEWIKENVPKGSVVLPLFLLDHSGITMSTGSFGDPWDSGQVGIIFATPEQIREAYMVKRITKATRAKVEACLKSEVEVYDHYITGSVWGYVIEKHSECDSCGHAEPEHIDSCFGFYGYDIEGMVDHAGEEYREQLVAAAPF